MLLIDSNTKKINANYGGRVPAFRIEYINGATRDDVLKDINARAELLNAIHIISQFEARKMGFSPKHEYIIKIFKAAKNSLMTENSLNINAYYFSRNNTNALSVIQKRLYRPHFGRKVIDSKQN